jgi:flavin-dependent dehydrogenase
LFRNDEFEYDVLIIGGAFSGAATALMLKRKRPDGYAGEQRNPCTSHLLSWQ